MHLYSNTDFPGLPVIQFLIILCIEFNSTITNRLFLQFILFRNAIQSRGILQSYKTSRNFILLILLKETHRILLFLHSTEKDNSTTRSLRFIHAIHICVSSKPSKAFQTSYRAPPQSSILQLECIFYHWLVSRKLHRVPVENFKLQLILQTFILQRKGDVALLACDYT